MKLRPCFAALLAAAPLACSAPETGASASAIVGGDADTTTRGVVLVEIHGSNPSDGWSDCSGTVISPHVVVTAAHCLDTALLGFGPDPIFHVYVGDDIYASPPASDFYGVSQTIADPTFDASTVAKTGHDVGVVVTTDALPITPIPFVRTALDASFVGQPVRLVGFGLTDFADASSDGRRNSGSTTAAAMDDLQITTADALPSGCEGDSGGAMLATLGGVETLVGAISHGVAAEQCKGASMAERIDVEDAFLEPIVQANDPGFLPSADEAGADAAPDPPPAPAATGCGMAPVSPAAGGALFALAVLALTAASRRARRTRGPKSRAAFRPETGCRSADPSS